MMKFERLFVFGLLWLAVHFSYAQTTTIQVEVSADQDPVSLEYFPPIGGVFFNKYLSSVLKKNAKEGRYEATFELHKPSIVLIKGPMGYMRLYMEPNELVQAKLEKIDGQLKFRLQGKNKELNDLFIQWLPITNSVEV